MGALENLHARLFVHTDNETTVLIETQGVDIQVADVPGLGLECRVMAIEPVHAPMRFEVSIVENTPESGAAHRPGPRVVTEGSCHVIETPPCRGAVVIGGRTRGDRQDIDTLSGGKAPRPTWAQRILQTGQPVLKVPGAPEADGLAVTVHVSR